MSVSVLSKEQQAALDAAVFEAVAGAQNAHEARNSQILLQVQRKMLRSQPESRRYLGGEVDKSLQRLRRAGRIHFRPIYGWRPGTGESR